MRFLRWRFLRWRTCALAKIRSLAPAVGVLQPAREIVVRLPDHLGLLRSLRAAAG
jgi:hypothetical protein